MLGDHLNLHYKQLSHPWQIETYAIESSNPRPRTLGYEVF